jgi:LacI family transcriptional regulator
MATIRDVARTAQVSIATVSHVINGTKFVSEATRFRVEEAIAATHFVPNVGAQALRNGRTRSIGLVASDVTQYVFGKLIAEIEREARADGLTLFLANSGEDPDQELEVISALLSRRVDGLIVAPVAGSDHAVVERCVSAGCPVVFIDRINDPSQDQVGIDNRLAMSALTSHLIDSGYRHLALLAGDPAVWTLRERVSGFQHVIEQFAQDVRSTVITTQDGLSDGRHELEELFARTDRPDAVIAASAPLTIGALQAFRRLEVRVPDDVAFVSFDGVLSSELLQTQLTCVVQPVKEIAAEAMSLLRRRMGNPMALPVTFTAPASLFHGTSCGCGGLVPLGVEVADQAQSQVMPRA